MGPYVDYSKMQCICKDCTNFELCIGDIGKQRQDDMDKTDEDQYKPYKVQYISWEDWNAGVSPDRANPFSIFVKGYAFLKRLVGKLAKSDEKESKRNENDGEIVKDNGSDK